MIWIELKKSHGNVECKGNYVGDVKVIMSFILKRYREWGLCGCFSAHLLKYFHKPLTCDILSDIIVLTHSQGGGPCAKLSK